MSNRTLVINDLHLGVQRSGGTTLTSADELRDFALQQYRRLLNLAPDNACNQVVVNGDLTDVYDVPLAHALEIYEVTNAFLIEHPTISITWGLGNHDLSKDSSKLGTVAFIGAILAMLHTNFKVVAKPELIQHDTYLLPHVVNQDVFDLELTRVPEGVRFLLLHCNFDNMFACASDHSLNITRDQVKEMRARNIKVVLGHEHQGRESLGGTLIVVGNQFPTSIADCLPHGEAQKGGTKHALVLDHDTGEHSYITTWTPDDADGWFAKVGWEELKEIEEEGRGFIRVEGEATQDQATLVIKAISAFRNRSKSFVITNAVRIDQAESMELADSIEDIRSVNVIDLLMEQLDPPQQAVVRALLAKKELA